jgi:nitrogen regulatory protein PII 2
MKSIPSAAAKKCEAAMKELLAIIRINKVNETKRALVDAGLSSLHAAECLGRGKGIIEVHQLGGASIIEKTDDAVISDRLYPKRMIDIVLPDTLVQLAVKTIIDTNKTGQSGDGKIFIMPVTESYRVRTGESGDSTLD